MTWEVKPPFCFNVGVTFEGLRALGTPEGHLRTFPTEFRQGMTTRAMKIGDFGDSGPEKWPAPFDQPERVHLIASVHADDEAYLDQVEAQVAKAFTVLGVRNGRNLPEGRVFFGYVDGISQPRFKHVIDPDMVGGG